MLCKLHNKLLHTNLFQYSKVSIVFHLQTILCVVYACVECTVLLLTQHTTKTNPS